MIDEENFVCRPPRILRLTSSLAANETSDVMLSCLAEGDPAPEVVWRSPTGDRIGVRPPSDRQQTRTTAFWELRNVPIGQSGWYSCNATSPAGTETDYTYLHVPVPGDPPVDLTGLEYPAIPQAARPDVTSLPVTSSTPFHLDAATASLRNATAAADRLPPTGREPLTVASGSGSTSAAHARWTEDTGSTAVGDWTTGAYVAVDDVWRKALLIVGCVTAGLVLIVVVVVLAMLCARLRRRRRKRRRKTKSATASTRPPREDYIRRPKFFPGVSIATGTAAAAAEGDGQALRDSPQSALPSTSPSDTRPERLDLLSAEYDRNRDDSSGLRTFERTKKDDGANGCG